MSGGSNTMNRGKITTNGDRHTMNERYMSTNEGKILVNGSEDTVNEGGTYGEWRGKHY